MACGCSKLGKDEAERIATSHVAGTSYPHGGFEGSMKKIRFGGHRSTFKRETTRVCEDGSAQGRNFTATFGIGMGTCGPIPPGAASCNAGS